MPLHEGRCIVYDGNCSKLPSESSCKLFDDCKTTVSLLLQLYDYSFLLR
eukprot:COSAG02_NODE_2065_length_9961_cov_37.811397_5_plen_49_part_00